LAGCPEALEGLLFVFWGMLCEGGRLLGTDVFCELAVVDSAAFFFVCKKRTTAIVTIMAVEAMIIFVLLLIELD
jgi:hypothetical protein